MRGLVRGEGVDVIHTHHSHDHWLGWLARGAGPAALVRTFHNARAVRLDWPSTALYRRTDALIAVSGEIEERGRRAGIPAARLARVDGVVDLARFETGDGGAAIREEFELGGAPVLGCVARLAPRRGHELLIRGFRLLLAEYPEARLLLVGKGEARGAPRGARRASSGSTREVLFTGYRDADLPGGAPGARRVRAHGRGLRRVVPRRARGHGGRAPGGRPPRGRAARDGGPRRDRAADRRRPA